MDKRQSGSLGGKATLKKYGKQHFQDLAAKWHAKYELKPYNGNDFLIIDRATGKPLSKTLNGDTYEANHW